MNYRFVIGFIVFAWCCHSCSTTVARADPIALSLFDEMLAARGQLQRGEVTIKGKKRQDTGKSLSIANADVKMFVIFDHVKRMWRHETTEYYAVNAQPAAEGIKLPVRTDGALISQCDFRLIRSSDSNIHWEQLGPNVRNHVSIRHPRDKYAFLLLLHPFDIRAVGIAHFPEFSAGTELGDCVQKLKSRNPTNVTSLPNGVMKVTWTTEFAERTLDVDTLRGMTPVHLEVWEGRLKDRGSAMPSLSSTVNWEQKNGVWVPTNYTIGKYNRTRPGDEHVTEYEFSFDWKSVNVDLPESAFSYKAWSDLPRGSCVYDYRFGDKPQLVECHDEETKLSSVSTEKSRRWTIWLGLIVLLITVFALWLYLSGRKVKL